VWNAFIDDLRQWQNLVGAVVGGIFALGVAVLVAYLARSREDRAAAMILTAAFVSIRARHTSLERLAKEQLVPANDYYKWLSEKLIQSRPKLSQVFEGSLARLMLVNTWLAVHLELFRTLYHEMDEKLERLAEDYKNLHENGAPLRPLANVEADQKLASDSFAAAVRHASCAEHLLALLVLGRMPTWHALRLRFLPDPTEKQCRELDQNSNS